MPFKLLKYYSCCVINIFWDAHFVLYIFCGPVKNRRVSKSLIYWPGDPISAKCYVEDCTTRQKELSNIGNMKCKQVSVSNRTTDTLLED